MVMTCGRLWTQVNQWPGTALWAPGRFPPLLLPNRLRPAPVGALPVRRGTR